MALLQYMATREPASYNGHPINTLRLRQNGWQFADDIFKYILNEIIWISIKISLNFVPKGPVNNIPLLVQIMAWHRPSDKPLYEPMVVRLPTPICVTWPQWVNESKLRHETMILLTHCGLMMPYNVAVWANICSGNGSLPVRHQAITWNYPYKLLIGLWEQT